MDWCVRPPGGSYGAEDGADWANALDGLPPGLIRGDTYYLAAGSYPGYTFDDAVDGTTYITVKKATVASHGTETGWDDAFATGEAAFGDGWGFATGYYDIDGVTGGGPGASVAQWPDVWTSGFGISLTAVSGASNIDLGNSQNVLGLRFRHLRLVNETPVDYTGTDGGNIFHAEAGGTPRASDVVVEYCYVPAFQGVVFHVKEAHAWTVQYCRFAGNGVGNDANVHRQLWSAISNDNWIWRWNYIVDISNTGIWSYVNDGESAQGIEIYGNIVDYTAGGQAGSTLMSTDEGVADGLKIFNNTVVGWNTGAARLSLNGGTGTFRNNLYAHHVQSFGGFLDGTVSHNSFHDMFREVTGDVTAGWAAMGTDGQALAEDPFADYAVRDLRLKEPVATDAGSAADSPVGNAVDMFGTPRGWTGAWARGALEIQQEDEQEEGTVSKSNFLETALLQLLFNATAIANLADNAASSPLASLYVSLHTADPGEAGDQTTSEAAYTSYARVAVARTSGGWTVSGASVSPVAAVEFPEATGGTATVTHFGVGTAPSGAGNLLYSGTVTPNISVATGVTARLTTGSTITED